MGKSKHTALLGQPRRPDGSVCFVRSVPSKAQRAVLDEFGAHLVAARDKKNRPIGARTKESYLRIVFRLMRETRSTDPGRLVDFFSASVTPCTPYGTASAASCALMRYASWNTRAKGTPAVELERFPYIGDLRRGTRAALSEHELKNYYDVVIASPMSNAVKAVLLLLPRTGLRIGEIVALRHVDVDRRPVMVRGRRAIRYGLSVVGKREKVRWIALGPNAAAVLSAYAGTFEDRDAARLITRGEATSTERLFKTSIATVERELRNLRRTHWTSEADGALMTVTPHVLRHVWATHAIRRRVPLEVVQKQLGHASYATTVDAYVHVNENDLAEATSAD